MVQIMTVVHFVRCRFFMASISLKRARYRAIAVCTFVFWLSGIGINSKAEASCGDYLNHAGLKSSKHWMQDSNSVSNDSSPSTPRCKNGQCRSAPHPLPIESSRMAVPRQQPDRVQICNILNACSLFGSLFISDESMPIEPSLDLPDPPPRAMVL